MNRFFKHSVRAFSRQKGYLLINIIGLSIGITSSLLIALFIIYELRFDQFNEKKDRIYRLVVSGIIGDRELNYAVTSAPVGPTMKREFPEIEDFVRINKPGEPTIKYGDTRFTEHEFLEADSSFFNIFSYPLIRGNKDYVLNLPHTLVLSHTTAKKIFGSEDPLDKMIQVGNDKTPYMVTGIMADMPDNSHIRANMIGSFVTNPSSNDPYWANNNYATYILLKPNSEPETVNVKMPDLIRKYMGEIAQKSLGITIDEFIAKNKYNIYLQSIKDIHLNPAIKQLANTVPANNPKYLYIFGSVALLIIIIAAINFMNLSTAQSSARAKEVGIKKVSGSLKGIIIRQFLTESILLSLTSLILAVILTENILPYFNNLLGIKLQLNPFRHWYTIPALLGATLIIGLFSGSYPAFFLSSFEPIRVLKGKLNESLKNGRLRSILVIIQFSISIVLIVGTFIMFRQIRFMLYKDLGFNKNQLMIISHASAIDNHIKTFKEKLLGIPEVMKVSASTAVPGHSESGRTFVVEGRTGDVMEFKINYIDYDFFDTYGMKLYSGRFFDNTYSTDENACIVNESAVKQLNLGNPFATVLVDGFERLSIIGVAKNFNYESLQNEINPYIFKLKNNNSHNGFISIRLSPIASTKTINEIEKVWDQFAPDDPFQYFFMDQDFAVKFREERQNAQLSVLFTLLAIIIASVGLFGLVSFTIKQRTKEIAIRKILGSSIEKIFCLYLRRFILLVFLSALISWPLTYIFAKNWLQNFYYRIDLRIFDFLTGFIIVLVIVFITIGFKLLKSARTNPVNSLRYE
jgi:putative ABC transport system permease protein